MEKKYFVLFAAKAAFCSFAFFACAGQGQDGDGDTDGLEDGGADADTDSDTDADSDADADTDADGDCPAAKIGEMLGRDRLMLGGSMADESFAKVKFDLRYQYLAGNVPPNGPCASCAQDCVVDGQSCDNSQGCSWWGCWQYDQDPPGRFAVNFAKAAHEAGAVPMFSYYVWFSVAGGVEGEAEIALLSEADRVAAYLADFRFLLGVLAEAPEVKTILHIEPDLWGYGQQVDADPTAIPVALSGSGEPLCLGLGDNMAGFAKCMLAMARSLAPNVLVGFHASAWGAGSDALINADLAFDLDGHAVETAGFMRALGADGGDLIVVEMSDRDAGFNNRWWDASNATLPNFNQAILWAEALGREMALAQLWWQVPYGHMGLANACDSYEDNRVDYFFGNPNQFAAAGALGIAFGAGASCMTTAETDGGHFLARSADYYSAGPPMLCGD
jgi:hypothetical protein